MAFAGVDWGEREHVVTVVDERGGRLARFAVQHTAMGLAELVARLRAFGPPAHLPIGIERPSGVLVDTLLEAGHPVIAVHSNAVKATRPRYRAAPGKSDGDDSYVLADMVRTDGHRLRVLRPLGDALRALRALARAREDLIAERLRMRNQLAALLASFWPGAAQIFSRLDSAISLAFLERYPTPEQAAHLGVCRMRSFLRRQRYSGRHSPAQLLARLDAAPRGCAATAETASKRQLVLAYVSLLSALHEQLRGIDRAIGEAVHAHPDGQLLLSLPAVAQTNAAQILAELTDDRSRYASREHLAAESGVAPVTKQSGKSRSVTFRWACNKRLRAALTTFANNSRRQSSWAAHLYAEARRRGADHPHSLRVLARAWTGVLWRLWQDRRPYDPMQHRTAASLTAAG
jgi:transposase